eukprot:7313816-Prymnesium_polylepis.1
MDAMFGWMDAMFGWVDAIFGWVDAMFGWMDAIFGWMDAIFGWMDAIFGWVDAIFGWVDAMLGAGGWMPYSGGWMPYEVRRRLWRRRFLGRAEAVAALWGESARDAAVGLCGAACHPWSKQPPTHPPLCSHLLVDLELAGRQVDSHDLARPETPLRDDFR